MQQDSKQIIKGLPRRIALMLLDCGLIVLCYWPSCCGLTAAMPTSGC